MNSLENFVKLKTGLFRVIFIFIIILLSNVVGAAAEMNLTVTHPNESGRACTDCHNINEGNNNLVGSVLPVSNNLRNSNLKISRNAIIQSNVAIQGGGSDCVFCHDINGSGAPLDKRIDTSAIKQGVHRNLNNGTSNTTVLSDIIDKACWACHGNGTEPAVHPNNYKTPYACADCHNATYNLTYTDPSIIPFLTTRKVYEHIPPPYYQEINSIINNSNATCTGCHNMSMANYASGFSIDSNVSHYASRTNLVSPTSNCNICHKSPTNASAYWANVVRHPAKSQNNSFCANCHNTTLALDLHSPQLVKPVSIHFGFDWYNDDYLVGPNLNEACISCHGNTVNAFRRCEDCHLENGSGSSNTGQIRPDINDTIPRVYAHTNFSTIINVPDQSNIYPGSSSYPSTCFSGNSTGSTCHGNPYGSKDQNGGYYATITSSYAVGAPYHSTDTIDKLPNTTNCIFCHKQNDTIIRNAWGNATQITEGRHNWYTGDDNSRCWRCHTTTGVAPKDFHSNTMRGTGGDDCMGCHVPNDVNASLFGRHANINTSDGIDNVSNFDCWTCHYQKDMNLSHIFLCDSCHTNSSGVVSVTDPSLIISNLQHGSNSCKNCHAPDLYHVNGTVGPLGRIQNPGWQLISPIDGAGCHDCHRTHNGLDAPFHGPGIDPRITSGTGSFHVASNSNKNGSDCSLSCHSSTVHNIYLFTDSPQPSVINVSIPSTVLINSPFDITASGSSVTNIASVQIEAAQYRVKNSLGQVMIDWTAMNPQDGKFNSSIETVNATINTMGLPEGMYNVSVRVMAAAPKTNTLLPYYPLNGDFSNPVDATLVIEQPKGFINGTVKNSSSNLPIEGAAVTSNTGVTSITDSSGSYSLRLGNGTYFLNATKEPEYNYNNTQSAVVFAGTELIRDIELTPKPVYVLSGKVTNISGSQVSGASVKLVDYPKYNATTDVAGDYSMGIPPGTYQVSVSAKGYITSTTALTVSADAIRNFILTPGGLVGEYRYFSLSANGISSKKLATQGSSGTNFIVPQYGDNVVWKTTVRITDMSGVGSTLTVKYYDMSGTLAVTETMSIPSNGVISFVPSDGTNGRPTTGKLVITSTQNIAGTYTLSSLNPADKTLMTQSFYSPAEAATNLIIPQYGDKVTWGTYVAVSDVAGTGATLTVQYYDMSGNLAYTQTQTVPANGMVQWFPTSISSTPATGKIVITSTGSVIGEYRLFKLSGTGLSSNKLYSPNSYGTRFTIPQYGDKVAWGTYVAVSDVAGTGATLTVKYYDMSGTLAYTETQTVPANGTVQWLPTSETQTPSTGRIEITSTANVVGEYRIFAVDGYDLTQLSLFSSADQATSFVVPYYGNNVDTGTYIAVSDAAGTGATLTVKYYTLGGILSATTTKIVPPNGMVQWFPYTGDGVGAPSEGKVIISS
jgi:hypothetical protein